MAKFPESISVKINNEQKAKIKDLRASGVNLSQKVRNLIEELHKQIKKPRK